MLTFKRPRTNQRLDSSSVPSLSPETSYRRGCITAESSSSSLLVVEGEAMVRRWVYTVVTCDFVALYWVVGWMRMSSVKWLVVGEMGCQCIVWVRLSF